MKCIRIKFVIPKTYRITFEENGVILQICGRRINFFVQEDEIDIYRTYVLKSDRITDIDENCAVESLRNALQMVFTDLDIGLLIGGQLASGVLTKAVRVILEMQRVILLESE